MAEIFPKWANRVPGYLSLGVASLMILGSAGVWYFFSPEFTDVGYQPLQPVPFSHKLHAGELRMDCRYCHTAVEVAPVASVPSTQTCMNCHRLVARKSGKLELVRNSFETGEPIRWVRVHKVPEFAYFDHSAHISARIGCSSCHGNVAQMDEIRQTEPLSMNWCLSCHRDPDRYIRRRDQIMNTSWAPPEDHSPFAKQDGERRRIKPPTDCSACHR